MSQELAVQSSDGGMTLSVDAVVRQREKIKEIMTRIMREGVDFGYIPGCPKPSLFKPGAEKLCSTFMLAVDPKVEDLSSSDEYRYRVTVRLVHQSTGIHMGSGVGEAGTNEEKYRWRMAICDEEYNAVEPEARRLKFSKDRAGNVLTIKQVRTNPADLANTVLKMASKRGHIAVVLTVLGASDFFTQDIEDMPAEYLQSNVKSTASAKSKPAATAAPQNGEVTGVIEKYFPPKGKGPHCIYIGSVKYSTFDADMGDDLSGMTGQEIDLKFHTEEKGGYVNHYIDGYAPASISKPEHPAEPKP